MHDAFSRRGRDVHECFFRGEGSVGAEAGAALLGGFFEFVGELLFAGFAEVGEGGVVVEDVEEGVFVVGGGGGGHGFFWDGVGWEERGRGGFCSGDELLLYTSLALKPSALPNYCQSNLPNILFSLTPSIYLP